ncbi:hypothetical protein HDU81_001532, partial [Chytriomyces hyalinus]
ECRNCGETTSRQHGVDCAGIENELNTAFGGTLGPPPDLSASGATIIDEAIQTTTFLGTLNMTKIDAIYKSINTIRTTCSGYQEIIDASTATLQQELDAIFDTYEGPQFIRHQATRILTSSFQPANFTPSHRGQGNRGRGQQRGMRGNRGGRPRGRGRGNI